MFSSYSPRLLVGQKIVLALALCSLTFSTTDTSAQVAKDTRALYKEKVEQVLQQFPQARWAFGESEVVKHVVNYRAEQELAKELGHATKDFSKEHGPSTTPLALTGKNISKRSDNFETETSVAISRNNPKLIVAGANDDAMYQLGMVAYVTSNGGTSWATRRLPVVEHEFMIAGGDPVIVPDEAGGFYYSYLSYDFTFQWSDIQIAHSSNGVNWQTRSPIAKRSSAASILEDKQWMAVDREHESPFFGRIYMVWRRFNFQNNTVMQLMSFSDDKAATWSTPRPLNVPYDQFAFIRVGKGGTVFISATFGDQTGDGQHGFLVSTDGGESFTEHAVANYEGYQIGNSGRGMLKGNLGFRAFPYTSFDVDPISNEIFLVGGTYNDQHNIADLKYYYSSNGGQDWDEFSFIATSNFRGDRFMPAVAFDRDTRTAWATYFSSEHDGGENELTKVYLARLTSEGIARIDTIQDEEFDPVMALQSTGSEYIGDYIGSDASQGTHVSIWSQSPPGKNDAEVYGAITSTQVSQGHVNTVHSLPFELSEVLEQPVSSRLAFQVTGEAQNVSITLYDARSSKLSTHTVSLTSDRFDLDVTSLPSGFYYSIVEIDGYQVLRKFVKQ